MMETQRLARAHRRRFSMGRLNAALLVIFLLLQVPAKLDAAEKFRAASGGFGTANHAGLWAAYHKNIFQK